jgi:D-serine deaminase-like pyridoxal phosphate-dependent protein
MTATLTPYPLIDEAIALNNIRTYQAYLDKHQVPFRPHIKTHKQIRMAQAQINAGAIGINCQKVSEAEVFAKAGFKDILITYNLLGKERIQRLHALTELSQITVVVDSQYALDELTRYGVQFNNLQVLVECDTGARRCGVQSPEAACELAQSIARTSGVEFGGLMTYPPAGKIDAVSDWLKNAKSLCEAAGLKVNTVTTGGTPDMWQADQYHGITEYRAGTYIYNDCSLLKLGTCEEADCALTLQTTVVSRPTNDRAIIDAGSKALTSDLIGLQGYGRVKGYPEAVVYGLNEEHGMIDVSACASKPQVGEVLAIIPNHVCVISNLYDEAILKTTDGNLETVRIDARGTVY